MGENESVSSSVIQPADTSTPVQDPTATSEPVTGDTSAPVQDPATSSEPVTGDTSAPVQDSATSADPTTGDSSEIFLGPYQVIAEVVELPDRPFFTTPFEEYTVTEGLLLLLVVVLVIRWITGMLKGGFSWL